MLDRQSLPPQLALGIPSSHAHILSFLFTSTYVGSIYLSNLFSPRKSPRPSRKTIKSEPGIPPIGVTDIDAQIRQVRPNGDEVEWGSRDHPETIKRRMKAVGTATIMSIGGVYYVVKRTGDLSWSEAVTPTIQLLGLPRSLRDVLQTGWLPYVLAPTLLLGPLVAEYLDGDLWFQRIRTGEGVGGWVKRNWEGFGWVGFRNYIVGPITEELVFRSTIIGTSILGGLSTTSVVFGTPLWFGIAHAHHALEVWKKGGKTRDAAVQALAGCVFQLGYTTLFGYFASYLYIKTGSVLPPLVSHIFCNVMGIYLPSTAVARHPRRKIVIWGSYLAGIIGFTLGVRAL